MGCSLLLIFFFTLLVDSALSLNYNYEDYETMKKTIYAEARGEPENGQVAVAWVIRNRATANKGYFGGSRLKDVCRKPQQFEAWNGKHDIPIYELDAYGRIDNFLHGVLDGSIPDPTKGCFHYNNPAKEGYPEWTRHCTKAVKIANHQFYRCPV